MWAGAHAQQYTRKGGASVDYRDYLECVRQVISTYRGYWTTWDPAIGPDPGIAYTDTGGGALVCDSWTDQRTGFALVAPGSSQRPVYLSDSTHFAGRRSIQCALIGFKYLQGDFGSAYLASATRPYTLAVVRNRTAPVVEARMLETSGGVSLRETLLWASGDQSVNAKRESFQYGLGASSLTQAPHVVELWSTTTAGYIRLNGGTSASLAGANGVLSGQIDRITVGANRVGTVNCDGTIVELHCFTTYPGDAIALRLVSLIRRKWRI